MIVLSIWYGEIETDNFGDANLPLIRNRPRLLISSVVQRVADRYGIKYEDLIGPSRSRAITPIRQEAMWECRRQTERSYPQIARIFHRDHTTVIHGARRHQGRLDGLIA